MAARNSTGFKVCTKCEINKPFDAFYFIRNGRPTPSCKECSKARSLERYHSDPDVRERCKALATLSNKARNAERLERASEKYRNDPAMRERLARNQRDRYQRVRDDPLFKLRGAIGCGLRAAIRQHKSGRRCFDVIGYSVLELKAHLERQFVGAMCWENYGEWHIDHITPVSAFDFAVDPLDVARQVWALPNLRPLWKLENMKKHAKVTLLL